VGHIGEQRSERDHELNAERARQVRDVRAERPPAEVRLDAEQQSFLGIIDRNSDRLLGLVSDLLSVASHA
jgi:signal transduction histidine kinase